MRSVRSVRPSEIIKFVRGRKGRVWGTLEKVEEEEVGSIIDSDWASNIYTIFVWRICSSDILLTKLTYVLYHNMLDID